MYIGKLHRKGGGIVKKCLTKGSGGGNICKLSARAAQIMQKLQKTRGILKNLKFMDIEKCCVMNGKNPERNSHPKKV